MSVAAIGEGAPESSLFDGDEFPVSRSEFPVLRERNSLFSPTEFPVPVWAGQDQSHELRCRINGFSVRAARNECWHMLDQENFGGASSAELTESGAAHPVAARCLELQP